MNKEPAGVNPNKLSSHEKDILSSMAIANRTELTLGMAGQEVILKQYPYLFGRPGVNALGAQTIAQTVPMSPEVAAYAAQQSGLPQQTVEQPATQLQSAADTHIQDAGFNFAETEPGLAYAKAELGPELTVAAANGFGAGSYEAIDPDAPVSDVRHDDYVDGLTAEQQEMMDQARAQLEGVRAEQQPSRVTQDNTEYGLAA